MNTLRVLSATQLKELTESSIEDYKNAFKQIYKKPAEEWVKPFIENENKFFHNRQLVALFQHVSPDSYIRDISRTLEKQFDDAETELKRKYAYSIFSSSLMNNTIKYNPLENYDANWLHLMQRDLKQEGFALDSHEYRLAYKKYRPMIKEYESEFMRNLAEDTSSVTYKDTVIPLTLQNVIPLLTTDPDREKRIVVEYALQNKLKDKNLPLLKKVIEQRNWFASLFGDCDNFTKWKLQSMSAELDRIKEILYSWNDSLNKLIFVGGEIEELKALNNGNEITMADLPYVLNEKKKKENFDYDAIRQYFPYDRTIDKVMEFYEELLNVKFEKENTQTWHDSVQTYRVYDPETPNQTKLIHLDLVQRSGKFPTACCHLLQNAGDMRESVLIANFNNTKGFAHTDIITLIHEFAHLMHTICSKAKTSRYGGTNVIWDTVEIPSKFMEKFAWCYEILKRLSCNEIPDDIAYYIQNSEFKDVWTKKKQIMYALFDLELHSRDFTSVQEIVQLSRKLNKEIMGIEATDTGPDGGCYASYFPHICSGYESQYYSYLWSEYWATKLFDAIYLPTTYEHLNTQVGTYLRRLYKHGGELPYESMIKTINTIIIELKLKNA